MNVKCHDLTVNDLYPCSYAHTCDFWYIWSSGVLLVQFGIWIPCGPMAGLSILFYKT